ncbi:class I SAM-dependent DNA methyltransferase [Pseudovibrio sp. Ad26]|uniref:type I restriction-modification system subunit M n=1 Tax=Pseudovibrio sp. Ad26 TaxID=989410 RepID=UPI0007AE5217|nr:class I SAM-dependent DNA methyltransferase [Pseudovibrio sp. Ad26]KZL05561.1 putative type I restriction enzymeP M protein [Pseudovibrio sp. Ad26]
MGNISSVIKAIQDIMRKDVGVDGDAQRIGQMVWMFFLKILDDREAELELVEDDFQSPIPEPLRWRNWAANKEGNTGEELYDFVQNTLFPKLKSQEFLNSPRREQAQVVQHVFADAYNYMKSGTLLRQVINKINEIDFNNSGDWHTFGGIYEQILKDLQSAGNSGEFYTPRAVTKFIVNRVDPQLDETVLDPACGTGGFLTCTIDHKKEHYVKTRSDNDVLAKTIRGVEKKPLPFMLCITNMILHGIDTPRHIALDNTLSKPYTGISEKDRVNVIVSNPPFGGIEEDGIEKNFPATYRTRETADLFIAVIKRRLKKHGRGAVVLPDGFLFGEGVKTNLKRELLEECNLHTVVRLPKGVFNPYTGIKTNILFFTKGEPTKNIWFYEHPYPEGVSNYSKTKPMRFEEFQPEIDWWGDEADGFKARKETPHAWKVSAEYLAACNYNFDLKNPHEVEDEDLDPMHLLEAYQNTQNDIQNLRDKLKLLLSDALNGTRK